MTKRSNLDKLTKLLGLICPLLIAVLALLISIWFDFTYTVKNFENVLDGSITFSSIIVGFLGALLGILVSIKDSEIVKAIFATTEKYTLKYYFYETFIIGVLVVLLSCTMHVVREYHSVLTLGLFYAWMLFTVWFLPSSFRIISVLMSVFFKANNSSGRPEGNKITDNDEREKMKRSLAKPGG